MHYTANVYSFSMKNDQYRQYHFRYSKSFRIKYFVSACMYIYFEQKGFYYE